MSLLAPPVLARDWDAFVVPDGYRAEIIRGELVVAPGPDMDHGWIASCLTVIFAAAAPEGYRPISGPEWRLETAGVVAMAPQPDLMVVRRGAHRAALIEPPLLAVEILSPADNQRLANGMTRREGKLADYAAHGLQDYLEVERVSPSLTVIRYELIAGVLVEVERRRGGELLQAVRPFHYQIRPDDLLS